MGTTNVSKTPAVTGGSIQFGAEDVRRMALDVFSEEGTLSDTAFVVSQRGAGANMSVDVTPGSAVIRGDDADGDQGMYYVRELTATTMNLVITAADPSNPRIDRVVLEIQDTDYDGNGLRVARVRSIDGTATAGANAATNENGIAAMPDSAIELARITVGSGVTTIVDANIVNGVRPRARVGLEIQQRYVVTGSPLSIARFAPRGHTPYHDVPYVKSGAACTNGGGLNLAIAAGAYCLDGYLVTKDASETVLLTASSTNRVWLQLTRDGDDNITGTTWNVQTGTTVPDDAVMVAIVVTGVSTITTISTTFRGIISPGARIATATVNSANSGNIAGVDMASIPLVGDGITNLRFVGKFYLGSTNASASSSVVLRDGASGGGSLLATQAGHLQNLAGGAAMHPVDVDIAATTTVRTIYAWCVASAGTIQHYGGIVPSRFVAEAQ